MFEKCCGHDTIVAVKPPFLGIMGEAGRLAISAFAPQQSISVTGHVRIAAAITVPFRLSRWTISRLHIGVAVAEFGDGTMVYFAVVMFGGGCELHGGQSNQR